MNDIPASPMSIRPVAPTDPAMRQPPHNFQAEQALLGAILANNRAINRVTEFLRGDHFAEPLHGRIYQACQILTERGQIANPVTLKSYLSSDTDLPKMGGDSFLIRLVGAAATIINTADYGRLIYDLHLRRELIALGEDVVNDAFAPEIDQSAGNLIEAAQERLYGLSLGNSGDGRGPVDIKIVLSSAVDNAVAFAAGGAKIRGLPTGYIDLDAKLGGLHPSDLIILAGRPAMGKSALATGITVGAAKGLEREKKAGCIGFFSLEMSTDQLGDRILAEESGISATRLRNEPLNDSELARLSRAERLLSPLLARRIFIDDTPALSIAAVRSRARQIHMRHGPLQLLVIDYLQLMSPADARGRRAENRTQEVSEMTRGLKQLAKDMNIPVIALSQLSRAVEQREDKRPQLSDLRESGSIEQDADVVMFVYREEYYLENGAPKKKAGENLDRYNDRYADHENQMRAARGLAEILLAKQRHGPVGMVPMQFSGELTMFSDLAKHAPAEWTGRTGFGSD